MKRAAVIDLADSSDDDENVATPSSSKQPAFKIMRLDGVDGRVVCILSDRCVLLALTCHTRPATLAALLARPPFRATLAVLIVLTFSVPPLQ